MHIRDLLPFHAMRTSVIRPRVELSLTSRAAPNWTAAVHLNRTAAVLPNWTAAVHLNRTAAVLPNWAAVVLSNRTAVVLSNRMANSRRPWGIARVVCGPLAPTRRPESPTSNSRISPDGAFEPSQTALLGQPDRRLRAGLCRAFSLRPRLTLACPSALVPVKATPTKPPARFPRGL